MVYVPRKEAFIDMGMRIRTRRDVWICTAAITVISIMVAELGIGALYLLSGPTAFHIHNAIIMSALMPTVIAIPITYYIARMSLALTTSQKELRRLADTDPLTRLPNRRSFFRAAEIALQDSSSTTALLVIDADHFKDLNDTYGHAVGDKALQTIADILRHSFRENDLICRVGGEEFAVLVPGMNALAANKLASRVVARVANNPLTEPSAIIEFSISCGVADTRNSPDLQSLFKAADDAMYLAKQQGRNRVVCPQAA